MVGEDQKVDAGGPCPRPKDGDTLGVAPKVGNVFTEPAQGLDLVQEPIVAFCSLVPGAEKTEHPKTVVERGYNDVAVGGQD